MTFFSLVSVLISLAAVSSYITYFVVVFSILVQSLTLGRVIRMSGSPLATPQSSARR